MWNLNIEPHHKGTQKFEIPKEGGKKEEVKPMSQESMDKQSPQNDNAKLEETITSLIKKNIDVEDMSNLVVNFSMSVMHYVTTTIHLLQVDREEIKDVVDMLTTSSLYIFLGDDWLWLLQEILCTQSLGLQISFFMFFIVLVMCNRLSSLLFKFGWTFNEPKKL